MSVLAKPTTVWYIIFRSVTMCVVYLAFLDDEYDDDNINNNIKHAT